MEKPFQIAIRVESSPYFQQHFEIFAYKIITTDHESLQNLSN